MIQVKIMHSHIMVCVLYCKKHINNIINCSNTNLNRIKTSLLAEFKCAFSKAEKKKVHREEL